VYDGHHASSTARTEIIAQPYNTVSLADRKVIVNKLDVGTFFKNTTDDIDGERACGDTNETRCTYFIAEEKVQECPKISVKIGEVEVLAILDTGCELTIMNENLYERIRQKGNSYLELPAQHLTLVSAFNDKGKQVKKQIFVPVKIGDVVIDQVFIMSLQLLTSAILGVDFLLIPVQLLISLSNAPFLR
jgi:CxxC motif-containing protein